MRPKCTPRGVTTVAPSKFALRRERERIIAPGDEIDVSPTLVAWSVVSAAGLLLSLRSVAVLRAGSPWSSAGWLATALYFALELAAVVRRAATPFHLEYVLLALLTIAFVVAGLHDERQAEPWWWPAGAGLTGRERRSGR